MMKILIGTILPKEHVASRKLVLHRTPEEVFALISDFRSAPAWRRGVRQVVLQPADSGPVHFVEKGKNGSMAMLLRESHRPTRLVTEIADKSLPFGGSWIFDISSTELGEVYNPFFRFVSRFVLGYTNNINGYLEDVANHFHESAHITDARAADR